VVPVTTTQTKAADFEFTITTAEGAAVVAVFVSREDIAEARATYPGSDDAEVAGLIFEGRYESALAKIGMTYSQAEAAKFNYTVKSNR
jgi:hypothetical protein